MSHKAPIPIPRSTYTQTNGRRDTCSSDRNSNNEPVPQDRLNNSSPSLPARSASPLVSRDSLTAVPPTPPRRSPQASRSTVEPARTVEDFRQFAKKKLFTDEEFDEAVETISGPLDTNKLLAQLIAVRSANQAPVLPPRSRHNPPRVAKRLAGSVLRSIVIDGSNVAMT